VPCGDLALPADECAPQGAHLDRARLVLQITTEPFHEDDGQVGIVEFVQASHHVLGVPCGADFATWIAGIEQAEELSPAVVGKAFVGSRQQSPGLIEGIMLETAMAQRLVLHPMPALVELGVGEFMR